MIARPLECPPSSDPRWPAWARPLAALLRLGPQSRRDCARFGTAEGASLELAANLLPWLENAGYAVVDAGVAKLTPAGEAWAAGYRRAVSPPPPPPPAPALPSRARNLVTEGPFGRLTPKRRAGRNAYGDALWLCECACGTPERPTYHVVSARHLRSGHSESCGCLQAAMRASGLPPAEWRAA